MFAFVEFMYLFEHLKSLFFIKVALSSFVKWIKFFLKIGISVLMKLLHLFS